MRAEISRPEKPRASGGKAHQRWLLALCSVLFLLALPLAAQSVSPAVGQKAPQFSLRTPEGVVVRLSDVLGKGPVVLIVLRGYPGYQCPYCQRQVHDFIQNASQFGKEGAAILLVYPGPPADLGQHARDFLAHEPLPPNVHLVIDPDYKFTNLYGLRWNAPGETAYPSTFLLDRAGVIFFRKISQSHGDRATAANVLAELQAHGPH